MPENSAEPLRARCRAGTFSNPTSGMALGHVQANLVVLPKDLAYDFLVFCQRNPKPCPLLEVTEPGDPVPRWLAPHADLRTDLPRYRVFRDGQLSEECTDIIHLWRADLVAFLLGCSFTFEAALADAGLGIRHWEETRADGTPKNVPMYRTTRPCHPAGLFQGPLVVSMRPYTPADAIRAVEVTARCPRVHGAPVHWGSPDVLGITALDKPDWGDPVTIRPDEIPVFWACGVTPQAVVMASRPSLVITHAPGHMFVCDLLERDLRD